MKHVVSISLGSSTRDKKVQINLGDETMVMERIGCDGDEKKARALFNEMDGKVDAFGLGGVELYVRVAHKSYPLRSGLTIVKDVKKTPYTDGRGVKMALERNVFQLAEPHFERPIAPRKAMMTFATDRYGMAESLDRAGFDTIYCDLLFALGLSIPLHSLKQLQMVAAIAYPLLGWMPISVFYPTGQNQDEIVPKYEKWFNYGPVIAGDFQYIRRHMPADLSGKIIITNTTTQSDVDLLESRGLWYLVTTTPRLDGRSFGSNVLEAALIAYAGKGRPLSDVELDGLVDELDLKPGVHALNPA
jgi:hypothetical protein